MAQYKCVPGPINLNIASGKDFDDAIMNIGDVINRECVGGWEFYSIYPIQINKKATGIKNRLMNALALDMEDGLYTANMLVFKKD